MRTVPDGVRILSLAQSSPIPRLTELLGEAAPAFSLDYVEECSSTNDLLASCPAHDTRLQVLIAHHQSAGRGRRGRHWLSPAGQGLTFSCGWSLAADAPPPTGLSLTVGLALAEALEDLGARGVALKWPNDLLIDGAKLAGVLVELSSGQQRTRRAIIGIGLNLRADHPLPGCATALQQHVAELPPAELVLATILLRLRARLNDFARGGFATMRADWQQRDAFVGRMVRISGEAVEHSGLCAGVADDGALLLQDAAQTRRILSGEVSLRAAS